MNVILIPAPHLGTQRLPEEEATISDLLKVTRALGSKAANVSKFEERIQNVEEYFKTSNFSSKLS